MNLEKLNYATDKAMKKADKTLNRLAGFLSRVSPIGATINHEKISQDAYLWADDITTPNSIFSNPYNPQDLKKSQTRTIKSASGKKISGLTLPQDWSCGDESGVSKIVQALALAGYIGYSYTNPGQSDLIAVGLGSLFAYKFIAKPSSNDMLGTITLGAIPVIANQYTQGHASTLGQTLPALLPAFGIYWGGYLSDKNRAEKLLDNGQRFNSDMNEESSHSKLEAQIRQAIIDDSKNPTLTMALASGIFQKRGSFESPDAGTELVMNWTDLAQHMFIMGKPGTGKSLFLKNIIYEAYTKLKAVQKEIGMLIMDGKGELALECAKLLDLIISPQKVESFCLIDGVDASKWQSIIKAINNVSLDSQNSEFKQTALEIIYNAALAHEYLKDIHTINHNAVDDFKWSYMYRYNLMEFMLERGKEETVADGVEIGLDGKPHPKTKVVYNMGRGEQLAKLLELHPNYETDPRIKQLIINIYSNMNDDNAEFVTKCLKTAQGYMQAVLQHKDVIKWADCETTSINVLSCLSGGKIGVAMPPEIYGVAGSLVSQLVKAQVRNAIACRNSDKYLYQTDEKGNFVLNEQGNKIASGQTELLFVQDEFQDLFNSDDENNVPKDRSRGCYNVIATQTLSAIYAKSSKREAADTFLTMFASFVALKTTDKAAEEMMQLQCGHVKGFETITMNGPAIAFRETSKGLADNLANDPTHPDAKLFKKFRTNVEFAFLNKQKSQSNINDKGLTGAMSALFDLLAFFGITKNSLTTTKQYLSYYQYSDKQDYKKLLGDELFGELDKTSRAVVVLKRGGGWVKDIATLRRVSSNLEILPWRN